jgi:hypothetical protein
MLRIPHCLDSRLTDSDNVVRLMHWPRFTPQKKIYASGTHFGWRLSKPQDVVRPEGLGKFKNHLLGSRTLDLPACSIVP